ncbi:MAG: putative metal-binding motif-containing protein [Bacteroidetes bacterium]|nr:putative metal-binding motif-containing protein [Bacteroidota bacterium]
MDGDCNDAVAAINPGAQEICDGGIDNDCDGLSDDADPSVMGQITWYADADGDGYGDLATGVLTCNQPLNYILDNSDCNDAVAAINPGATEVCNGIDDDCDGDTDDDDQNVVGQATWYADADGDTYGDAGVSTTSCNQPIGYVSNNTDCDDADNSINPGATEACNGVDDDCNGLVDDNLTFITYYNDFDGDGYGVGAGVSLCSNPGAGYSLVDGDCNDAVAAINPGAQEICDGGIDNDCDGLVDDADPSVMGQGTYYADGDGDGYGAGAAILACIQPVNTSINNLDCNDADAAINPAAQEICDGGIDNDCDGLVDDADPSVMGQSTYYADVDGDGYGAGAAILACIQPINTSTNNTDCNDADAAINPGAQEICDGGIDNDCDGLADDADPSVIGQGTYYADVDGDGYGAGAGIVACIQPVSTSTNNTDCNDAVAAINPGAQEICDGGIDNDCDGLVDDADPSVMGQSTYYADVDGDGYGAGAAILACIQPVNTSTNNTDCNDAVAAINPGAQEICDGGIDNDCDGLVDDADPSVMGQGTYYADVDGDGYGAGAAILACIQPLNTSINNLDCNDADAAINPAAQEICDGGIDNDCDGLVDDADPSVMGQSTYYADVDGDGYGAGAAILACIQPINTSTNNTDCNDAVAAINPGAQEICDGGIDNDCDGLVDDADPSVMGQSTYYADVDGDGYGAGAAILACIQPVNTSTNNTDCNDAVAAINPGAQEICDGGIDNDCDGLVDDADPSVMGQGTYYADVDGDGYGAGAAILACIQPVNTSTNNTDCNDAVAAINPGAQEICDGGIDNDCDGLVDDADPSVMGQSTYYADVDGDGYGAGASILACIQPVNTSINNLDCNDNDILIHPAAQEICDGGIDNDCDGLADDADPSIVGQGIYFADNDGDGYGMYPTSKHIYQQYRL